MENMSYDELINMTPEQFIKFLIYINKKLRNLDDNKAVLEEYMTAGDLVAPTNEVKEKILNYLCLSMKNCKDNISCAAMVYYTLINLHLFSDGNGRTSRYLFDLLSGNNQDENIGYYYHKEKGKNIEIKDNFELSRGILDPSRVNIIPDEIIIEKLNFIPYEILEKYSWIMVGRTYKSKEITDILPENVLKELSNQELNDLDQILSDSLGCGLTPAGLAMIYVTSKKGQLNKWLELDINNMPIEFQKKCRIERRLCFPIFRNGELIADWTTEDFRTIIKIGNMIKYERLKCLIDIFATPSLYIDKDNGITYRDEIITNDFISNKTL